MYYAFVLSLLIPQSVAIKARKLFENVNHIYWSFNFVILSVADVYYVDFICRFFKNFIAVIVTVSEYHPITQIWFVCQSAHSFNSLSNIAILN